MAIISLKIKNYINQSLFIIDKLKKLSYVKGKFNYNTLTIRIRILLSTFIYKAKSQKLITVYIFKIVLLLKELRFFIIKQNNDQLIIIINKVIEEKRI